MKNIPLHIVILAAGKGVRMHSTLPKVMHPVAKKPLLSHVIDTAKTLEPKKIHVVYGFGGDILREHFKDEDINWVEQKEQLGTGHAVLQAMPHIPSDTNVLILYGDVPLLSFESAHALIEVLQQEKADLALLTLLPDDPTGFGRIIRNEENNVVAIIEDKDVNEQQKAIKESNSGIMAASAELWQNYLAKIKPQNVQHELYLTDVLGLSVADGKKVQAVIVDYDEVLGVNTKVQLAEAERIYQKRVANKLMQDGVTLLDPARFDLRGTLTCGQDVTIDINSIFEGEVKLGNNVVIGPNCYIKNITIADNVEVKANSHLEDATIEDGATIGPFARLRPGALIKKGAKVGNFVEIKKSTLGENSKASHLTYLGDTEVGKNVNIGAGTITCNYDGANKHKTVIEDEAFIGSNVALVAPVKVGANTTIGAGSTITKETPKDSLVIARSRQTVINNWQRPKKNKK